METNPKVPMSLLRQSHTLMFEPPSSIKANLTDSLKAIASSHLQKVGIGIDSQNQSRKSNCEKSIFKPINRFLKSIFYNSFQNQKSAKIGKFYVLKILLYIK